MWVIICVSRYRWKVGEKGGSFLDLLGLGCIAPTHDLLNTSNDGRTKLREWLMFSVICYSCSNGLSRALATKGCDFSVQPQMQECLD